MGKNSKKCASFYIEPRMASDLKKLAKRCNRSVSSLLCILIAQALAKSGFTLPRKTKKAKLNLPLSDSSLAEILEENINDSK